MIDLDQHWATVMERPIRDGQRFSMGWYRSHLATQELLNSNILCGDVLDIGCGTGHRAFIAHEQSKCSVVGVDGSGYAINYAEEAFGAPGLKFILGDVTSLPLPDNVFNNAYMLAVIEHVKDTKSLLSEIKRVIKGRLFLCVTENDYHGSPDHVHKFSKKSLQETFNEFNIINSFVKGHIIFMTVGV